MNDTPTVILNLLGAAAAMWVVFGGDHREPWKAFWSRTAVGVLIMITVFILTDGPILNDATVDGIMTFLEATTK